MWEDNQKVPYMFKDDIWISYDDARSMKNKVKYLGLRKNPQIYHNVFFTQNVFVCYFDHYETFTKGNVYIDFQVEYAKAKNLLGISVWSLGIDDFRGTCKGKPNVLLNAINDAMVRIENFPQIMYDY